MGSKTVSEFSIGEKSRCGAVLWGLFPAPGRTNDTVISAEGIASQHSWPLHKLQSHPVVGASGWKSSAWEGGVYFAHHRQLALSHLRGALPCLGFPGNLATLPACAERRLTLPSNRTEPGWASPSRAALRLRQEFSWLAELVSITTFCYKHILIKIKLKQQGFSGVQIHCSHSPPPRGGGRIK